MNYFVYKLVDGRYLYDRNCGTQADADKRAAEYKAQGIIAVWLLNHTIKGAFH